MSNKTNTRVAALRRLYEGHRELLGDEQARSVPDDVGTVAIINSFARTVDELFVLMAHVERVQHREERLRGKDRVRLIDRPTKDLVLETIADRDVSSLIFIGHGTLGTFGTTEKKGLGAKNVAWTHLGELDHVKTGKVEQRTCGNLPEDGQIKMPLCTFAIEDQRQLWVPLGQTLEPHAGFDDFSHALQRPFHYRHNDIPELLRRTNQSDHYAHIRSVDASSVVMRFGMRGH